ncbi:MAG: glutamate synthase large subunit, partial [Antricoccus sp.]
MSIFSAVPEPQGLYDPADDVDSCGVAFVVDILGRRTHQIVRDGLTALENMDHRGAAGADAASGDGAGMLTQIPHDFFLAESGLEIPNPGSYCVGQAMLPLDPQQRADAQRLIAKIASEEQLTILGWREVPTCAEGAGIGSIARGCMPSFWQAFITSDQRRTGLDLERAAFVLRRRAERATEEAKVGVYFSSMSPHTIVYKGMLTTNQLGRMFPDLHDERYVSALSLVHSRFSTNTFPSWPLAHPFRFIAHNGEINTIKGNRNRSRAREALLESDLIPGDLSRLYPICTPGYSDSGSFDEVLELLYLGGRSLAHAMLMMIPEAWENNHDMPRELRDFYRYHASLQEPWDGPACVTFTNGTQIGAVLDRNGLRPGRWWQTKDDIVILASESGVLDIAPEDIVAKGRLRPGRMFLVDTEQGRIIDNDELKEQLSADQPYGEWLHAGRLHLEKLPPRESVLASHESVVRRQQTFGYTEEEVRLLIEPMARSGTEPLGSMGTDTPLAVLSQRPRLIYDYFAQLFAQVTNPPLDAIREELVTSLARVIGPEQNLLEPTAASCRHLVVPFPVIDNDELARVLHINDDGDLPGFEAVRIAGLYRVEDGEQGLRAAIEQVRHEVSTAIADGARMIVLSDRDSDSQHAPIPSLLLTSAVHHHLLREKTRLKVGLIVESGDCREVHHVALLLGFGAAAVNPYLAFETIADLVADGVLKNIDAQGAVRNYVKALGKGVLKVMSKMGISTVGSYTMAQIFEAIGLSQDLLTEYFTGIRSRLGGIGLAEVHGEVAMRHRRAYPGNEADLAHRRLEVGGEYQWRREGELHLFNPETVFLLQHATRSKQREVFKRYTAAVDQMSRKAGTLRGLFAFKEGVRAAIPLAEVEPASEIVKRFSTGAMSYGSISAEAHIDLAIAMNRIGAKSNTGEGGEDVERLYDPQRRSAVKQIASGRFGVTSEYLVNADDLQIKIAQGAKPGEGGQLPGFKVYPWIGQTRHSTPGVGLISPPPHHDIYSIEDLAQLIHDLKNANEFARVHVKLVAQVGVGTVAAGVSKAHADVVLISGHDGGTGATPLTSQKHSGAPWEVGLADTQQTLIHNGLRDRIVVQVDGQMKTGRDVIIGALLGAEEFGFA